MASSHPPAFIYTPLSSPDAEIRLLRLLRSSDTQSPIYCSLRHASLKDGIAYETLSYHWGDESKPAVIYVDGASLSVTRNLHLALRSLRNVDSDRDLWIDAICINQKDTVERGREVLRMLDIYRQAIHCFVWLGEESDSSALAFERLRTLAQDARLRRYTAEISNRSAHVKKFAKEVFLILAYAATAVKKKPFAAAWVLAAYTVFPWSSGVVGIILNLITLWQSLKLGFAAAWAYFKSDWLLQDPDSSDVDRLYTPNNETVAALTDFFSRPWFYRVWVIQEVVASQDVTVNCGQLQLPWIDVCDSCDQIDFLVSKARQKNAYVDTLYASTKAMRSLTSNKSLTDKAKNSEFSLIDLLRIFRHFGAKDPRDKVYALLGLAKGVKERTSVLDSLQPNYAKSIELVYEETVRFLVTQMGNLDILRFCEGSRRRPGLATWAPDWTVVSRRSATVLSFMSKPCKLASDPSPDIPAARFSADMKVLTTRGFIIGHLADEGDCIYTSEDPRGLDQFSDRGINLSVLFKWTTHYVAWLLRTGIFEFMCRAFIKILTFFYPEAKEPFEPYHQMISELVQDMLLELSTETDSDTGFLHTAENIFVPSSLSQKEETFKWTFTWQHSMPDGLAVNPGKCHTMAPNPRKGDLTCLFIGASTGTLLRSVDDYYEVIGDADFGPFVKYFWRDCEKQHKAGTLQIRDFELR